MKKVGIIVGSLRKESFNKKVADAIISIFPKIYDAHIIPIGDLPLYDQDLDMPCKTPLTYTTFRKAVGELDGVIFVTPEYNRGLPAVLKNAIDVASRPNNDMKWNNMPAGIVTCSPGRLGGFGANHQLRQALTYFNMPIVGQPEMYMSGIQDMIVDNKPVDYLSEHLIIFVNTFIDLMERNPKIY